MTICDTILYQMSENDPNTEIFKVFSVFGQTKCHGLNVSFLNLYITLLTQALLLYNASEVSCRRKF